MACENDSTRPPVSDCCAGDSKAPATAQTLPLSSRLSSSRSERLARMGAVVSAVVASSCCWLPPILILVGVSGAGVVAAFETYRPIFLGVTFACLAAAFYFTYRPRRSAAADCCSPQADCCAPVPAGSWRTTMMAMNKVMLWGVTALAVAFAFAPQYITSWLAPDGAEFTPDMSRVVLRVEGMTCKG